MPHFLYSAPFASFVFDERFNVVFEMPFPAGEQVALAAQLQKSEWIEPEKNLLVQYPDAQLLGFKAGKGKFDVGMQKKVATALANRSYDFVQASVLLAKHGVRDAFTTDDLVLQATRAVKEHERTISSLVSRLREWYELYNPETSRAITDNEQFVGAILSKTKEQLLGEIKVDLRLTMGANIPMHDVEEMLAQARVAQAAFDLRAKHLKYVADLMQRTYPNITAVGTPLIAGQLLAMAGSLRRLALMPASTIQLLGAERALFRHLKDKRSRPPKHGVLANHPLMAKVPPQKRGKLARLLADKLTIAARLDYFKGEFKGDALLKDVEAKMNA